MEAGNLRRGVFEIVKALLIVLLVASASFVVSAPFLVVERWLGFCVLVLLAVSIYLLRRPLKLGKRPIVYASGLGIALALLIPASYMARFIEGGFDDGPFVGRDFNGDLDVLKPSDSVLFRSGRLYIYNRKGEAPVIAYRAAGKTKWAREMFVSMTPGVQGSELSRIESPALTRGILRDRLDFVGYWTYGAEHGYAFIWKFGGIQRFYLSW